jgi:dihydropteroate synthase
MDESQASSAALGLRSLTLVVDSRAHETRDALAAAARQLGVECITHDGWILLAGSAGRLAGLTRRVNATIPQSVVDQLSQLLRGLLEPRMSWTTARGSIDLTRPVVAGILNITPDSFSDGGSYLDTTAAIGHAEHMIAAGAGMLDLGAQSSRPGRPEQVSTEEEWRRLAPVLGELVRSHPRTPISVDTVRADTAARALEAGAWAINDVSGLRLDPAIADVCVSHGAGLIVMHSRGSFAEMATYDHAQYSDVVAETAQELVDSVERAESRGVERDRVVIDPGLGFSKLPQQNYAVIAGLPALTSLGLPVMLGPSRKRFLGTVTDRAAAERDHATAALCVAARSLGANLFRVHAVRLAKEALDIAAEIESA